MKLESSIVGPAVKEAVAPLDASVNAFLIQYEDKLVLIDAGSSELVGPTAGKLPQSLRAAGVAPENITDIFVTHIHPDHTGGLMNGNTKVFPNATIHINKREVDYWFNKSIAATAAEPGFRSEPAYGHTAGLTVYILENGGEKVKFWGDVVNILLQVDNPDISLRFDSDTAAAAATRRRLLEDAARKGYIVAPDHLPFPGLGHIRKDGHAYTWAPVDYVNDALAGCGKSKLLAWFLKHNRIELFYARSRSSAVSDVQLFVA